MIPLTVITVILIGVSIFLIWFSDNGCDGIHTASSIFGWFGLAVSAVLVLVIAGFSVEWVSAKYKADILNREYKTNYTQAEVFYASDVIDTIRQLDRKRIELNGDIMRGVKDASNR